MSIIRHYQDRFEATQQEEMSLEEYLDLCMSWGPLILGHAHTKVVQWVQAAASRGLSYGACHVGEVELAERILRAFERGEGYDFGEREGEVTHISRRAQN